MSAATPAPDDRTVGQIILNAREGRGWRQVDLHAATDVNQGYISQIETGDRTPSRKVARLIAMALGMTAEERDELLARIPSSGTTNQDSSWFLPAAEPAAA